MRLDLRLTASAFVLVFILLMPAAAIAASGNTTHPLINRIWDTRTQQPVSISDLERRLQGVRYVLLGEVHDNSIHHRLRRDLIAALVRAGRRPAIAMEQFDREQQPAMDRAIAEAPRDPERLRVASGFNNQGWNWPDYAPIISLALDAGLPLLAANLSRDQAFRIATSNAAAVLGEQTAETLGLNKPLPQGVQRKLERVIDDGHCGKAPATILPGMIAAQRARDAVMAQIVTKHANNGIVLIAGNGHVRRDFGVPFHLRDGTAMANLLAVGFIEVQDRQLKPADYFDLADPEYDYIVFTERMNREDPCATLSFRPRQPTTQP